MFLKNKNIIFTVRRSKVTDYAALTGVYNSTHPLAFASKMLCKASKMLCKASKSFDNLCSTFLIYSISGKIGDMRTSNLFGNFTPLIKQVICQLLTKVFAQST